AQRCHLYRRRRARRQVSYTVARAPDLAAKKGWGERPRAPRRLVQHRYGSLEARPPFFLSPSAEILSISGQTPSAAGLPRRASAITAAEPTGRDVHVYLRPQGLSSGEAPRLVGAAVRLGVCACGHAARKILWPHQGPA